MLCSYKIFHLFVPVEVLLLWRFDLCFFYIRSICVKFRLLILYHANNDVDDDNILLPHRIAISRYHWSFSVNIYTHCRRLWARCMPASIIFHPNPKYISSAT